MECELPDSARRARELTLVYSLVLVLHVWVGCKLTPCISLFLLICWGSSWQDVREVCLATQYLVLQCSTLIKLVTLHSLFTMEINVVRLASPGRAASPHEGNIQSISILARVGVEPEGLTKTGRVPVDKPRQRQLEPTLSTAIRVSPRLVHCHK